MAKKWIQGAIGKKGALHRSLGISQNKKIPADRLTQTVNALQKKEQKGKLTKSELTLLRRANLAKTLKRFHK
ncbi:MAG: hypothetical protein NT145_03665 [Elusimicrobia bacterium]|nr:hypothetical protein [Elusimicrobiota bacterium]